jgi:NAD(P)-dependent dehydrogenase (short-subunit alcohol dehydrogenase family)
MLFSLQGKTAIVTGGASGIGLAISKLFAQQGAAVHILELNFEQAEKEIKEIRDSGGKAFAHRINIAEQEAVKNLISEIAQNRSIDILVNNAGIAHIGNADNTAEADFDRIVAVNIKGTYNCLHAVSHL